jgi:CheY-like chemotaxis protein
MTMRNPSLLLVEDDDADALITTRMLGELYPDLVVQHATSVERAMVALEASRTPPDLVLVDLNLHEASGFDLIRRVRSHRHLSRLPVIVLTTSDHPTDISLSYEAGANAVMTKSLMVMEFKAHLKAMANFWLKAAKLPVFNARTV